MSNKLYTLKPDELIAEYRNELRRLYGDEKADKFDVYYERGWYYIKRGRTSAYRRIRIIEFIENLRKRKPGLTR